MALGIGYGLPFVAQHGTNPYKTQWSAALEGAKGAGASVEDENAGTGSCLVARGQDVYTDGLPFTPSLLIVPQFYKDGNLYQDVPPFVAEDSTMRFTVSRNTTATRFNSAGLLESVASGIPRLDYYTSGGVTGCPALLVEPAALNLALHSRDLTNAVWSGTNITTAKNAVGADGVASGATTLTATAASGTILQSTSHNQFPRVFSAYVRRVTGTGTIQMTVNGGTNWDTVTISSTYTQVASAIRSIASGTVGFRMAASGDVIEVDFTQYEATTVTSPIPTTSGAVSRAADVISASGALVSGLIGQTEGTIYAEVDISRINTNSILSLNDGTGTNRFIIQFFSSTVLLADMRVAGVNANFSVTIPAIPANGGIYKVALGYKANDYCFALNGTTYASTLSRGVPATTQINLGNYLSGLQLNDRIRAAALYTTRLSNDQLAELTRL